MFHPFYPFPVSSHWNAGPLLQQTAPAPRACRRRRVGFDGCPLVVVTNQVRMKNSQGKNKQPVGLSNDDEKKTRRWEDSTTEVLIDCALEQVNLGEHTGTGLTKQGWRNTKGKFRSSTGLNYDDLQIKNKWDALKKKWQLWYRIFGKVTGVGWNYRTNNFDAAAHWWENILLEEPEALQFERSGLKFKDKLTSQFAPGTATGEHAYVPSSGMLPEDIEKLDTTEGSGDSEDPDIGRGVGGGSGDTTTGGSFGFGKFTLNNSAGSSLGGKKRKQGSMMPKGSKPTQRKKLNNYIEQLIGAVESRTTPTGNASNDEIGDPYAISSVMKVVKKFPGMEAGSCLLAQCNLILKDPLARQMFVALEDDDSRRNYMLEEIEKA